MPVDESPKAWQPIENLRNVLVESSRELYGKLRNPSFIGQTGDESARGGDLEQDLI